MMRMIKPMPPKPLNAIETSPNEEGDTIQAATYDPISYAVWKMNCMNQLKEELEGMFEVIERKVGSFEKKLSYECCSRNDKDKLLKASYLDYSDSIKLSKDRLQILLVREQKRHQDLIDELRFKKKAWESEL